MPAPKELLTAPAVAWPTLALLAGVLTLWAGVVALALTGALPEAAAVPLLVVAAFAAFTPMHDAAHRSVARARWVNEVAGRLAAPLLGAPFVAFRYVHLEHHKHTNEPGRDPDLWSGTRPLLLLRWLTQDLHYYAVVLARRRERPRAELAEVALVVAAQLGLLGAFAAAGHLREALLLWLLPGRLAIALLAWSFDYVPHRPHVTPAARDRLRATHVVRGPWTAPLLCDLCRARHNQHYADLRVMPTRRAEPRCLEQVAVTRAA
ncbi:MAG: fatty acid desaturase [Planctomycetes bacterium]|nr:fatty acid desaturase [Planctomycetota bacterium]